MLFTPGLTHQVQNLVEEQKSGIDPSLLSPLLSSHVKSYLKLVPLSPSGFGVKFGSQHQHQTPNSCRPGKPSSPDATVTGLLANLIFLQPWRTEGHKHRHQICQNLLWTCYSAQGSVHLESVSNLKVSTRRLRGPDRRPGSRQRISVNLQLKENFFNRSSMF